MEYAVLGWPADGPTLDLDHERFSYAGKFVMSSTGKAVARATDAAGDGDDRAIVAAVAFDEDRTDETTLRLRYVTVRQDRQGAGIGPRLARFVVDRARRRGYETVTIAVNNPFAYHGMYRAGFGFTGEETGLAELVLATPTEDRAGGTGTYEAGLEVFLARDLRPAQASFVRKHLETGPPEPLPGPDGHEE
jgi:GNAT superfamily N-acetyltransferase